VCYVILAKELIAEGVNKVITKNTTQKEVLSRYVKENKINCGIAVTEAENSWIKGYVNLILIFKLFAKVILYIYTKNKKRTNELFLKPKIILIDTFILKNSLSKGKYIDRYYSGIQDYVDEDLQSRLFWIPTILSKFSRKQLKSIWKNSSERIIYKHDLLCVGDYFSALYCMMAPGLPKKLKAEIRGLDVTSFVLKEYKLKKYSNSLFEGLLNYRFVRGLKKRGVDISLLIDWNENQPIDKGLIKGVHDFYPEIKVKGYQGYIISTEYNFYIQPTDFEIKNGVIPDEICVVGKALENRINKFTDKIKVTTAPAFRFQGVFKNYEKISDGTKKILVALPIGVNESYDILTIVSKALFLLEKEKKFQLLIKPHPVLNVDKLKKAMGSMWNKGFKMVNGDFNELVSQMDLLIGSTSTTLLETLTRGVPVIVVGSQNGITQNPIPYSVDKRVWRLCYTEEDLAASANHYLKASDQERILYIKIGNEIRCHYFEPVEERGVEKFLS